MIFFVLAGFFAGWQFGILVVVNGIARKGYRINEVGILPGILAVVCVILGAVVR